MRFCQLFAGLEAAVCGGGDVLKIFMQEDATRLVGKCVFSLYAGLRFSKLCLIFPTFLSFSVST